jgi:hypothetical protein
MSKTEPLDFNKSSLPKMPAPPPSLAPAIDESPRIWHEKHAHGTRESGFTTVKFALQSWASAFDTLTIEIDEHNGVPSGRLTIRGQIEVTEMLGHLRWLADAIARCGEVNEDKSPAIKEHVTCNKKWRRGRA